MAGLAEDVDPAQAKRLRKEAKRAAAEAAAAEAAAETAIAEAKRLRKAAKCAAAAEPDEVDPAEAKRLRKAAKRVGVEEEVDVDPAEAKVAAKRAAPEGAAAAEVAAAAEEESWFEPRKKLTKTQRKAAKRDGLSAEEMQSQIAGIAASVQNEAPNGGKGKGESGKSKGESSKSKGESGKSKDKSGKSKGKGGKSKGNGAERNNELTAFVANLPFSVKGPFLRQHFEECGQIDRFMLPMVDMVRQLYPKGIAFVQYATQEALQKALALNETDYDGRVISVTMAGQGGKSGKDV